MTGWVGSMHVTGGRSHPELHNITDIQGHPSYMMVDGVNMAHEPGIAS